jgi:heme exporter protein D
MPDLGDYGVYVLAAYGFSILVLVVIVALSMTRAARVRAELERIERGEDG